MLKISVVTLTLTGILCLSLSNSVFAKDISPFDLVSGYLTETKTKNYVKLRQTISEKEAMALDEAFSKHYGAANINRFGVKVWEIPNSNPKKGEANHITVTCGPEGDGFYISVDARGVGEGNAHLKTQQSFVNNNKNKQNSALSNRQNVRVSTPKLTNERRKHILKPNERD